MDFLDPQKRKSHGRRLFVGYALMAVLIGLLTFIILLVTAGFRYDAQEGVVRNSLVFVNSAPRDAAIFVNGKSMGTTNRRLHLPAGDHRVELFAEGYRTWRKDISLVGGEVERLTYPFLFPLDINPSEVHAFEQAPNFITQSPDRRFVVFGSNNGRGDEVSFTVADLSTRSTDIFNFVFPEGLLSQPASLANADVIEWADQGRHALFSFDKKNGGSEYVLLDILNPNNSVNLNQFYDRQLDQVKLRDGDHRQFYILDRDRNVLESAGLDSQDIRPIISRVINFASLGSDTVLYVEEAAAGSDTQPLKLYDGSRSYTLLDDTVDDLQIDLGTYRESLYVVYGQISTGRVYIYRDPLSQVRGSQVSTPLLAAAFRLNGSLDQVEFSPDYRMVMAKSGSQFAVYDNQTKRDHLYEVELSLTNGQSVYWMDDFHIAVATNDNKLLAVDFDGANPQIIAGNLSQYPPVFDSGQQNLFTLAKMENKFSWQKFNLVAEEKTDQTQEGDRTLFNNR